MRIEDRIHSLAENAGAVIRFAEGRLAQRVVYLAHARALREALESTLLAMNEVERLAVPADFDSAWLELRAKIAFLLSQCQTIIAAGAGQPKQPCRTQPTTS